MSGLEDKLNGEASTYGLNDPISESAAALNAYLSGNGAASPFQPGSALPFNRTNPAYPFIAPPEHRASNRTANLAIYIVAAVLFSIAVRQGALIMGRMVFAETAISQGVEPSALKRGERIPPAAVSEHKATGESASVPAGQGAAVIATSFSSHSTNDKESQSQATRPARPLQAETKPWSETVKAFKQLFDEQKASQAEKWRPLE
jgi:hypothetical protein